MTSPRPALRRGSPGSVTAETALALPVLALVVATGAWLVSAVTARVRCIDAARDIARAVARGDDVAAARATGLADAPAGAGVSIVRGDGRVTVTVRYRIAAGGLVPAYTLVESAVTALEPGPGGP